MNSKSLKEKGSISLQNTKTALETLIILANSEELLKQMKALEINEVLDKVFTDNNEDIDVLV